MTPRMEGLETYKENVDKNESIANKGMYERTMDTTSSQYWNKICVLANPICVSGYREILCL